MVSVTCRARSSCCPPMCKRATRGTQAIGDKTAKGAEYESRHRAAANDQEVRCHSEGHRYAQQQAAEEAGGWNEQENGAGELDHARDIAEPLADADQIEDLD